MSDNVYNIQSNQIDEQLANAGDQLVLIDFWSPTCGPCLMLTPNLEKAADELVGKVRVFKCNAATERDAVMKYGIRSVPTIMLFKKGELVAQEIGIANLRTPADIIAWTEAHQ